MQGDYAVWIQDPQNPNYCKCISSQK